MGGQVRDMTPGGAAAKSGAVLVGDVVVAVDPGRDAMQALWQYEQAGNRRWIDVRGWPEDRVPALLEGAAGTSLWLRLRRGDRDVVAHLTRGAAGSAFFAERSLELVLVTPDGERLAVPAELALEIRGVRDAFEPDLAVASCPVSPAGPDVSPVRSCQGPPAAVSLYIYIYIYIYIHPSWQGTSATGRRRASTSRRARGKRARETRAGNARGKRARPAERAGPRGARGTVKRQSQ